MTVGLRDTSERSGPDRRELTPPAGPRRLVPVRLPDVPPAVAAVLIPGLVMLGLGLWGLDRGTMWRDEAATMLVATRSLPEIRHLTGNIDAVHGVYYTLIHFVLGGQHDAFLMRLPSVLAASAAACAVAALGTRLARPRVGLWAGLLYATSPFTNYYAQEGRSYALVAAGAAAATLMFVRCVRRPSVWAWAGYAGLVTVTAWLHEFAVLVLVAHAVTLLLSRAGLAPWRGWAASAAATSASLWPLIQETRGQSFQVAWILTPGWPEAEALLRLAAGYQGGVFWTTLALVAAAVLGLAFRGRARVRPRPGIVAVALPLALVPPLVLFTVSQWQPLYAPRYTFFAFAGLPLLAAAGADTALRWLPARVRPAPSVQLGAVVALIGLAFWAQFPAQTRERSPEGRRDDFGAVARMAAAELRPGDELLYLPKTGRRITETYPWAVAGVRDVALEESGARSGTLYGVDAGPAELRARMACLSRVWVLFDAEAGHPGWHTGSAIELTKLDVLAKDFTPLTEVSRRSGLLRLYARDGGPAPSCAARPATPEPTSARH
ncbi:glycosyltransferase family 39 protein [Streptomyces sp. NPDC046821]|uniref:glycosyltransferase family 39 protein n=1 Tax=Streptomyces sp. NPDC046821 TaxID=3154702 RepID=UPI00340122DB